MNAAPSAAPAAAPVADAPARKTFDAFQRWYTNPAKRRRNEWPEDLTESDLEEMAALVPRFLHPDVSGLVLARALGVLLAHLAKERTAHADRAATLLEASNREAASFELRHRADMRAIARWQAATGRDMEWPDHSDLVVWLLERLEVAEGRATDLERQVGDRVTVMLAAADELERLWIEHGDGDASPKLVMRLRGELGGCYPGRCRAFQVVSELKHRERQDLLERWVPRCVDAEAERDLLLVENERLKAPAVITARLTLAPEDVERLKGTIAECVGQVSAPMVFSGPAVDVARTLEAIGPFVQGAQCLLTRWGKEPEGSAHAAVQVTVSDLWRIIELWESLKVSPSAVVEG